MSARYSPIYISLAPIERVLRPAVVSARSDSLHAPTASCDRNMQAAALGSCGNKMTIVMYSSIQEALYQLHYIYAHGEIMSAHGVLTSVQIMDHGMENKWSI